MSLFDSQFYWSETDGYSPEDPEDAFEPVGPYTSEDLAFLVNAQVEGEEPAWISETLEAGE